MPTVSDAPLTARVPVKLAALLIVWELIVDEVLIVVIPERAPALETSKLVELIVRAELPPPMLMAPLLVPVLISVVKLELLLMETAPPAVVIPVAPDITPALEISMLVVCKLKVPDPPPMVTRELEVPVLILVALLALTLILVTPVRPMLVPEVTAMAPALALPKVIVPVEVPVLIVVLKLELSFKDIAAPETVAPAVALSKLLKVLAPASVWVPVVTTPPKEALAGSKLSCWPVKVMPLALGDEPMAASVTALCKEELAA